jgi:hypothetical protein
MSKNELKKLRKIMGSIKTLKPSISKKADEKYFNSLEERIMQNIAVECPVAKTTMIDLIEGNLSKEESKKILAHISLCKECTKEYKMLEGLLKNAESTVTTEASTDDYFGELESMISEATTGKTTLSLCEIAQEEMINELAGETIPAEIKKHIDSCPLCKAEILKTKTIMSTLKELSVHLPNEKYFEEQLSSIDARIEELPSHRIARSQKTGKIASYIVGMIDTLRATIMLPQVAIASAALFALIIIGARFHYSPESIEERQINLSEVLNKNNVFATNLSKTDSISHPEEDQKLEIRSTGTAKVIDKKSAKN